MKRILKHRRHDLPALNTSSLPDLIFTVLFFFMIVTHMRQVEPKVRYEVPQGTELQKLGHKSSVVYIFIGRTPAGAETAESGYSIQLNDKLATIADIRDFVAAERSRMSAEDQMRMTVSIKADRDVPMGIIADVKQCLQQSFALRINYSANER